MITERRALLDRLSSTPVESVPVRSGAGELLPAPLDVAPYSLVDTNATCGHHGGEQYCRDTPGKRVVVCDVCEGSEGPASRRHPAEHAVDGDSATWWQSPTLASGDYEHVELIATLPDKMELLHVIIKSGPSPRPLAWSLEVSPSENGDDWRLVRAFGDREHCKRLWDLRPERRRRKARAVKVKARTNRADKPTCSTQFASPRPLENGEMHVGIGEGVLARRVRISFRAPHPAPALQQYYTVRALTLAARCLCHGHAHECRVTSEGAKCECLHGTCGTHCQRCCNGAAWAPHHACATTTVDNECECGERGACAYDDTGTILCVNCTENRAGPLCDRCLIGFYNAVPDGPCLPCNCDPEGSDGSCIWDKNRHQASCNCHPDFTGSLCDSCEDPLASFPTCQVIETTPACKCDPRGIVDPDRICDDVCECKANVVGERCDACAPGYFGLSETLVEGCRRCYCSHIADSCAAAASDNLDDIPASMVFPLNEGWLVTDGNGNETLEPSLNNHGKLYLVSYEVDGWDSFYWVTQALHGDQLSAYGSDFLIKFFWSIVRGDTGGNPTVGPDVILVGADGTRLAYGNRSHSTPEQSVELVVPLVEGGWYQLSEDPALVSRTQLMDVLRDLDHVMIRARFHGDQDEVRLEGVELRAGQDPHEQCACPPGYAGAHCSRCAWTHARVQRGPGAGPRFECVPCNCNGHAACETVDGPCGTCQHNTTGPHCERCLPGHYGNPVQGSCSPCACPLYLPSNNFSPNCALATAEGDEFVCTQCPDGYTGDHCEHCDFGYWGSPTTLGSSCQPCACGGAPCDPDTGLCLTCPPHTEGARCDQCQEGYWFGADGGAGAGAGGACVRCGCGRGALAPACDARSGQCACADGWRGDACDHCAPGHGGIEAGCPPCRCGLAATNKTCDVTTGACSCAAGAAPPACDACLPEHYGLNVAGCLGCNCSSLGAESNACDIRTGQCRCKQHVTGRACDTCEEGYWGLHLGGCRRCSCGAGAAACDPVSGACACAPGVGGTHCDVCLAGYYGFGAAGCLPCPVCTDGKVCSPETGRCVCPARSHGPGCRQCATGYYAGVGGCMPCRCGPGAVSNTCDPRTGECKCRAGWAGAECSECAPGYFGPRCRLCDCSVAGSRDCQNGSCPCDSLGRCSCKENVVGDKCDRCLEGTFGLSAASPTGCTACFCFGRTAHCTQAAVTRAALHAHAPTHVTLLLGESVTSMDQDSLLSIHTHSPDVTISLPWPPVPVYMELDKRFLGDRVTSYGGALRFKVEEEGGQELPIETRAKFPLVRLYGRHIVLDYHERVPPINGTHVARLQESLWRVRTRRAGGAGASRGALMLALQQLDRVMLRVTTRAPTYDEHVHALLLNVSLDTAIPGLSRSEPALGVEMCDCPRGYSAGSCQHPAVGFWIPPQKVHLSDVAGTIVINLEGEAQPCRCNGRAVECDAVTGDCLNCTQGTGGPRCGVCAEGYHGAPDAPGGCQACPCPSRARNFASACVMSGNRLQCLCKPGYAGRECESCAQSYVRSSDGSCVPCACDVRGAMSPHCDNRGRCRCRPFATGMKCDQCVARRTYIDEEGCKPCDNCTQTLLDSIEDLTTDLHRRADLNELGRIPKPFPALLEFAHNTTVLQTSFQTLRNKMEHSRNLRPLLEDLERNEHEVFTEANRLKAEASRREKEAQSLSLESMSGLEEILKQKRVLGEQVGALDDFARGERHLSAHRALKEARHLLRHIKDIKLIDYIAGANDVSDSANLQMTSVQERKYRLEDSYRRLHKLRRELEQWEGKAEDLARLGDVVWAAGDTVAALAVRVRPRLSVVRDTALRCRLVLEDITTLSPHNLTEDTRLSLLRASNLARRFPALTAELVALTLAAEEKEGILYNLTPNYRQKYLTAVEKHVAKLGEKAKEYKSLFAGTRALASAGVTAARAWSEVADTVKNASAAANSAAIAAHTAMKMARGPVPMTNTAEVTKAASEDLKRRGAAVLARAEELRTQLEHLRRGADLVSVVLRGLGWQERDLGLRPRADVAGILATANEQADRVFATTRVLYDEASEFRRRVRYNLRRQLAELQRHGDTALGAAQEHVSQIRGNTVRGAEVAEALAAAAAARAREHDAASVSVSPALRALKDKIARARHAADSISVSLTSATGAVGCARAYPVPAGAAAVTRVAVALSFDNVVRDGPLLYLLDDTQETENYIRLSVENKKLRLSWDLGGGEGLILHPEELQPAHDDMDPTSYRLEVERIWNTVHLTVERAGNNAITATNSSSPSAVTLRANKLWLGGPGVGLPGCVHALYRDDNTVGLWNFMTQPTEAQCTGCTQRWYSNARGGESLVWFNGAGYAELRRSGLRPSDHRQFSLAFTFRTRDEDALLFMAVDAANNRSVSVQMRACRVVFLVEYAASVLEITAAGRHCHGRPAHVQAIRVFAHNKLERGSLRVNGEETLGSPSPPVQTGAALPDLSDATYWLGGAPPGGRAPAPPLLGCLGGLTVDREGYDLLDTPTRHGIEARCGSRALRSATLEGAGYIELPSPLFRRKAALGLSFRARSPSGMLLFRVPSVRQDNEVDDEDDGDDKHYLALVMVDGELELIAAAGKAETRLRTNGTRFDDGRLHTVRIIRAHKQLELWVDEERVASGTLAGNAYSARARGLYVGGVDAWDATHMPELATEGFTGTIADLIVDSSLIGFESAVNWSGARLGRADSELRDEPRTEPRALQAQPDSAAGCTKTSSYTVEAGAVKFGDAPGSHAVLKLPSKMKELAISLQFRTFAPNGLLLFSPGTKAKPKHYLALLVREGKLHLVVRGRKRRQLALAAFVADGTWRSVSVRVSRGRLVLSSAGAAATAHAPAAARAPRLYVGGCPAPAHPLLPQAILRAGGFLGCVRRVVVGGRAEDLVREARAHHRVGQCFPNVEQGAYFAGDAHAAWAGVAPTETALELRAQFRTAEPQGVLLATRDFVLELRDGTLVLTRQTSTGSESSRTETRGVGGRALCDNAWHSVVARVSRASLALSLDAGPELRGVATGTLLDDDTDTPLVMTPLYIGGLPEGTMDSSDGGRENFKGCIRDVAVGGHKTDWGGMETLHNVLLDSCPVA
ncbi:laminin subunit alpha-2 [Pectinophora gossypiella]|uniref:laminin subunit alpha-2 n=1 Tax=Pectinophora gossypiella TaxID=13191 RepID=UPI00214E1591|nr:laminin subunit alpha-2 [Pectinophora gossypiella]